MHAVCEGEWAGGEGVQQLSSKDRDKWLSMTLTRRRAFFLPHRMERNGKMEGKWDKRGDESVCALSIVYWRKQGCFKTQRTFLVSLNGIEASERRRLFSPSFWNSPAVFAAQPETGNSSGSSGQRAAFLRRFISQWGHTVVVVVVVVVMMSHYGER